jgi:stage II sporulation protein D
MIFDMKFLFQIFIFIFTLSSPHFSHAAEKTIRVQGKQSDIVSTYHLEDYVASVLAAEMPEDFPLEALKAQAVLIRTLAMNPQQNHRSEGFDFCDTTHCQLFRPPKNIPDKFQVATGETRGRILNHDNRPIAALYHSACGGHTSPNHRVFGGEPLPYLQGVDDGDFCRDSPQYTWQSTLKRDRLEKVLDFSPLQHIQPLDAETDGRSFNLGLEGRGFKEISAQKFLQQVGQQLGWGKIKSAYFVVESNRDTLIFKGKGLGHGVGLCQWGARGMALSGKNYREILQHYFPGTRLDHD